MLFVLYNFRNAKPKLFGKGLLTQSWSTASKFDDALDDVFRLVISEHFLDVGSVRQVKR